MYVQAFAIHVLETRLEVDESARENLLDSGKIESYRALSVLAHGGAVLRAFLFEQTHPFLREKMRVRIDDVHGDKAPLQFRKYKL